MEDVSLGSVLFYFEPVNWRDLVNSDKRIPTDAMQQPATLIDMDGKGDGVRTF